MIQLKESINFDKENHIYTTQAGKRLISSSQLVKLYTPAFDKDGKIIAKCAAKEGVSVDEMRKRWNGLRDSASEKGTDFHSSAEHFIKTGQILDNQHKPYLIQVSQIQFAGPLSAEIIVWDEELGVAGTIDLIEEISRQEIAIWDWKTNKKLTKFSYGKKTFLPPLEHISDTIFNHYVIQLSIYAYILDRRGYWIESLNIMHINPATHCIEHHPVPYFRSDVIKLLGHYKQNYLDTGKEI